MRCLKSFNLVTILLQSACPRPPSPPPPPSLSSLLPPSHPATYSPVCIQHIRPGCLWSRTRPPHSTCWCPPQGLPWPSPPHPWKDLPRSLKEQQWVKMMCQCKLWLQSCYWERGSCFCSTFALKRNAKIASLAQVLCLKIFLNCTLERNWTLK